MACIIYSFALYHTREKAQINYKIWDMDTVTTGDFSVQISLPPIIWRKWNKRELKETMSFKNYFR